MSAAAVVVVSWCYTASAAAGQQGRARANGVGGSQAVYNRPTNCTVRYGKLPSTMVRSGGREGSCLGVV